MKALTQGTLLPLLALLAWSLASCFVGTPREELQRLGADIDRLPSGGIALSLVGTAATNDDLAAVAALCANHPEFGYLARLDLSGTEIDDQGLGYLAGARLDKLRRITLTDTGVSASGVAELRDAYPRCEVHGWGGPAPQQPSP